MRLRRWLALLVAGTLVPFLAFSLAVLYQYGREQSAAADRALQVDATITALRVLGTSGGLDAGDLAAFHAQCVRILGVNAEWRVISLFDAEGRRLLMEAPAVEVMRPESPVPPASGRGGVVLYIEDNLSNFRLVERMVALMPGRTLLSAIQGRLGLALASEQAERAPARGSAG